MAEEKKEERKEYNKDYYQKNKKRLKESSRQYRENNKEEVNEKQKNYRKQNDEKVKESRKKHYNENKEKIKKQRKKYYQENKESEKEKRKIYRLENKALVNESKRKNIKKRRKKDVSFRIRSNVSTSIYNAIRRQGGTKSGSTLKGLPYTIQQLKEYLESQFEPWMTWDNHGKASLDRKTWQIDHIIPHSSFSYTTMDCDEFRECWSLENLRPLEAIENIKKGNKK